MIKNKFGIPVTKEDFYEYMNIAKNSIYHVLCLYEEDGDWTRILQSIFNELSGAYEIFDNKAGFIKILCKLQSLFNAAIDSNMFRKTVFEVLSLIDGEFNELS